MNTHFAAHFTLPQYAATPIATTPAPSSYALGLNYIRYDKMYLTAIGLPLGGSSTVHIYTQTVHKNT